MLFFALVPEMLTHRYIVDRNPAIEKIKWGRCDTFANYMSRWLSEWNFDYARFGRQQRRVKIAQVNRTPNLRSFAILSGSKYTSVYTMLRLKSTRNVTSKQHHLSRFSLGVQFEIRPGYYGFLPGHITSPAFDSVYFGPTKPYTRLIYVFNGQPSFGVGFWLNWRKIRTPGNSYVNAAKSDQFLNTIYASSPRSHFFHHSPHRAPVRT